MLQQLAAAAKQDRQGQQEGARTTLQQLAATVGQPARPPHPTQAVQNGLQATQRQLSGLLDRNSRAQRQQQDLESLPEQAVKPSLSVLQQLLQLAVGDAQPAPAQQRAACLDAAGATGLSPAAQQQQWCAAAAEALQLFSVNELAHLPMHSLHQALLLQPELITRLLQAAAAAVLQPVLQPQAGPCSCPSMSQALAAVLPCWQQLPAVLAASPELLLQASADLLSWLQATGHQRLWQLASCLLRPAWQQLVAAATPGSSTSGSSSGLAASGPSGALWLACPDAQQQRLLQQLVQAPSAGGLLQLLELLPGLQQVTPLQGSTGWEKAQDAGTHDSHMGINDRAMQLDDAAAAAEDGHDGGELADASWPSWQEWQGAATTGDGKATGAAAAGVATQQQQQLDLLQVLGAWQLVVQHRCWYEFALHQLASCCLQHVAAYQQQQQLLPSDPGPAAEPRLAAAAAAFISWVQQPLSADRRARVHQQLLAPLRARHHPAAVLVKDAAQDQPTAEQACRQLLAGWQQAALPLQQAEAGCLDGAAAAPLGNGSSGSSSSKARSRRILPCLLNVDLPVALLQQQELLLGLPAQQLLQQLFPGSLAARPGAAAGPEAAAVHCAAVDALDGISAAALELFTAALQRAAGDVSPHAPQQGASSPAALDCSHWLARQWVGALSSSAITVAGATPGLVAAGGSASPPAPSQQQQQRSCGGAGGATAAVAPWRLLGSSGAVGGFMMATAKQLLVASTACDKLLRG